LADLVGVAGEESSRAAYLRNLDKELESENEVEKEEVVEEVEDGSSRAVSHSSGEHEETIERRVIRFEDGDLENPNNCKSHIPALILRTLAYAMLQSRVNGMQTMPVSV
jgi:hypothetical protein